MCIRDSRCEFCPVQRLLRQGEGGGPVQWEEVNGVTGRTYDNYDTLIRWVDGSLVHLQHSMDITASRRLSRAASTDELTDMLNRRAGKETAVRLLEQARQEHKPLTIALFDINVLKEVNDAFGHGEGAVSYTHLDVYKRQAGQCAGGGPAGVEGPEGTAPPRPGAVCRGGNITGDAEKVPHPAVGGRGPAGRHRPRPDQSASDRICRRAHRPAQLLSLIHI